MTLVLKLEGSALRGRVIMTQVLTGAATGMPRDETLGSDSSVSLRDKWILQGTYWWHKRHIDKTVPNPSCLERARAGETERRTE